MPQDVDFHIPLPGRQSPDHARADAEQLAWPRSLGLIKSEAAATRHLRGGYADLASRFYPHATGADLDLGVDLMSWFFLFDDLFDGPRGENPEETKQLTDAVAAALDGPLPDTAPPIAHGFADIWRRTSEGMTPAWCARSARHWRSYFDGYVDEAESRFWDTPYNSAAQYLAVRRQTIGVQPTVDLAERAGRFEVPHRVFDSAVLSAMLQIAVDVNLLLNDIASLEKEEARGEQNNMVMILRREHGWSKDRSVAHIQSEVRARLEQYLLLESCLPQVGDIYRLDEAEREALERYRNDAVRTVIRGSYDWHRSSGRYDAEFALAAGAQGYLEELGSTATSSTAHQQHTPVPSRRGGTAVNRLDVNGSEKGGVENRMTEQTTFSAGAAPGALPLVGHVLQMMRHPVNFMASLSAHGDLVEIKIGPTTAYVPTHPELLRHVLTNDRIFDKGGVFYDRARDIAGNGLVTCPFADHRRQRRLMQSAFTRGQLKRYAEAMHAEIEDTASRWQDGMVVDAFQEMYGMALRTVGRTLYSTPVSPELAAKVERSFDVVLNGLFRQMFLPASVRRLPLPSQRRYKSNLDFLHETTQQFIDDYRTSDTERDDLLAALIASRDDDGGRLGDKEIHDQVITVMAAGTETVAGTLTWVFYLLSQHPEIEAALYDEIDTVLDGRAPGWDDLPNLSLADRIISETLRLHPPAWLFTRLTASPTELAGRQLPTGSTVVFSPAAVAQYEDAFDNPKKFDPDRWLPDRIAPASRHAYVPFGTGARKCIGDLYARTEATLGLATILGRWRVTCEPGIDIRPVPLATVYHPRRLRLRLDARTPRRMTSAVPAPAGGDAT